MADADTGFLERLSFAARTAVERAADRRRYRAGEVLCHKGDAGRACFVILGGGVMVEVGLVGAGRSRRIFLGPGQIAGEMSLLSANPVTATVIAAVDTEALVLQRRAFLDLVDREPGFRDALFDLLIERMRHREMRTGDDDGAPCTLVIVPPSSRLSDRLCRRLSLAVEHYAPGSVLVDTRAEASGTAAARGTRKHTLAPSDEAAAHLTAEDGLTHVFTSGEGSWCAQMLDVWRAGGGMGRAFCLVLAGTTPPEVVAQLRRDDLVLVVHAPDGKGTAQHEPIDLGLATVDHVCLEDAVGPGWDAPWFFRVPGAELGNDCPLPGANWDPACQPMIDWLARRITGREVGLVLGAGAAAGLAHLGVLQVLEETGLVIDYLCGSSMGGIVAVVYSKAGSARVATEMFRDLVGSNEKLRDLTWWPKSALLRGAKRREVIRRAMGETTFAQLTKPAAVVAADVVKGERVVLEKGPTQPALRATSAIPGIFPPEPHEGRIFVDGAMVNRIPADLLERRHCGLKIAVNVVPSMPHRQDDYARLRASFDRFFGLSDVIASSWGLLAWWHGAAEARRADVLLEPQQALHSGYDYGTIEDKILAGRAATIEKLDMIREAWSRLLRPGAP